MDRDRYDAQLRAGQHHRHLDPAGELGQELGMARVAEARILQCLLLDRVGYDPGDLTLLGKPNGSFDRLYGRGGVGDIGPAGNWWDGEADR